MATVGGRTGPLWLAAACLLPLGRKQRLWSPGTPSRPAELLHVRSGRLKATPWPGRWGHPDLVSSAWQAGQGVLAVNSRLLWHTASALTEAQQEYSAACCGPHGACCSTPSSSQALRRGCLSGARGQLAAALAAPCCLWPLTISLLAALWAWGRACHALTLLCSTLCSARRPPPC